MKNEQSLDTLCAALSYAMGIEAPACANAASERITSYIDEKLGGKKVDRILMYNPDAVAEWIYNKYPEYLKEVREYGELEVPFATVMPSVTPVCFGTMYTGAQPAVHGIMKYEKPVIKIDTFFDALIRAGKKPVILSQTNCSMSMIYRERDMDYYIFDTIAETNAKAAELIIEDKHDVIIVYNTNYDAVMHKNGPEAPITLAELRANSQAYGVLTNLVKERWAHHDTLVGFAMDHGCHEIDGDLGSHGLDMDEDINIRHLYTVYPKK